MNIERDKLETRIATLELMWVTERVRPEPNARKIAELEQQLVEAKKALENYKPSNV